MEKHIHDLIKWLGPLGYFMVIKHSETDFHVLRHALANESNEETASWPIISIVLPVNEDAKPSVMIMINVDYPKLIKNIKEAMDKGLSSVREIADYSKLDEEGRIMLHTKVQWLSPDIEKHIKRLRQVVNVIHTFSSITDIRN